MDAGEGGLEVGGEEGGEGTAGEGDMKGGEGLKGGMIIDGIGMIRGEMIDGRGMTDGIEIGIIDEIVTTDEIEIERVDQNEIGRADEREVLVLSVNENEMKTARNAEIVKMITIKNETTKIVNRKEEKSVQTVATKGVTVMIVTTTMTIDEVVAMTADTMTEDETTTAIAREITEEDGVMMTTVLADETKAIDVLPVLNDMNLKMKHPIKQINRHRFHHPVTLVPVIAVPLLHQPPPHHPLHLPVTAAVVPPPPDVTPHLQAPQFDDDPPPLAVVGPRPRDPDPQIAISLRTVPQKRSSRVKSRLPPRRRDGIVLGGISVDGLYQRNLVVVVRVVRIVRRRWTRRRRGYVVWSDK